jgi:hypothetical protein
MAEVSPMTLGYLCPDIDGKDTHQIRVAVIITRVIVFALVTITLP